jgi:hypothetical protein
MASKNASINKIQILTNRERKVNFNVLNKKPTVSKFINLKPVKAKLK